MIALIKNFWDRAFPSKATRLSITDIDTQFPDSAPPFPLPGSKPIKSLTQKEVTCDFDEVVENLIHGKTPEQMKGLAQTSYKRPVAPTAIEKIPDQLIENWKMNNPKPTAEELIALHGVLKLEVQKMVASGDETWTYEHEFKRGKLESGPLAFNFFFKQIEAEQLSLEITPHSARREGDWYRYHSRTASHALSDLTESVFRAFTEWGWTNSVPILDLSMLGSPSTMITFTPQAKPIPGYYNY